MANGSLGQVALPTRDLPRSDWDIGSVGHVALPRIESEPWSARSSM